MSYKPNNCFNKNNYLITAEYVWRSARMRLAPRLGGAEIRFRVEIF